MKNLTPEIIKSNNVELTEEESKACFAQINENGAVSDDELEAVSGGLVVQEIGAGAANRVICKNCGAVYMRGIQDECPMCKNKVSSIVGIKEENNSIHKSASTQPSAVSIKK